MVLISSYLILFVNSQDSNNTVMVHELVYFMPKIQELQHKAQQLLRFKLTPCQSPGQSFNHQATT